MQLCAGRIGQLLNISDLAVNCGISKQTEQRWLSVLHASYITFLLMPYHNNFNKRLTRTPKLYFYDTGLACALLKIKTAQDLAMSPFKGPLFECLMISDIIKQYNNLGEDAPVYFWRDMNGRIEVDCLIHEGPRIVAVEMKSGETGVTEYFDGLLRWNDVAETETASNYVIYGGIHDQQRKNGHLVSWRSSGDLVKKIVSARLSK